MIRKKNIKWIVVCRAVIRPIFLSLVGFFVPLCAEAQMFGGVIITKQGISTITSATTGRVWMDRNLGATQAATSSTDANSYGYLYQWSRGSDGHQLRTSSTYSGPVANTASSGNGWNGKFITLTAFPYDWVSSHLSDGSLWWNGSSVGANNPCPIGFHVPTLAEWNAEVASIPSSGQTAWLLSKLLLPLNGYRHSDGTFVSVGTAGNYWSSTGTSSTVGSITAYYGWLMYFGDTFGTTSGDRRSKALAIRCIKN